MKEPYLKHLTVATIAICATIVSAISPDHVNETYMIFAMIIGYVLKNGYPTVKQAV